jgi:hypothetical protein
MTTKAAVLHAMRQKCLDCCCGQPAEVRVCHIEDCPLWPYRFGRDPTPSGNRGFAGSSAGRNGLQSRRSNAAPEKSHVYTCGSSRRPAGMGPGTTQPRPLAECPVYTDGFEQGEHLPLPGSIAEDVR